MADTLARALISCYYDDFMKICRTQVSKFNGKFQKLYSFQSSKKVLRKENRFMCETFDKQKENTWKL